MKAFEDVCQEEYLAVQKFLTRLCGNAELGQELTQETFYRAMNTWHSYSGGCSVYTWLCTIGKHLYWDMLRKKEIPQAELNEQSSIPDFTDQLVLQDRAMAAYHSLHALQEPYREVFTMRTFCDLSHAQIGELFGKSESWARVTYYRARMLLSNTLKEENNHED